MNEEDRKKLRALIAVIAGALASGTPDQMVARGIEYAEAVDNAGLIESMGMDGVL